MEIIKNEEFVVKTGSVPTKTRTTIHLPIELHKAIRVYCACNSVTVTQLVTDYFKKEIVTEK